LLLELELAIDFAGDIEARALFRGIFAGGDWRRDDDVDPDVLFVLLGGN
jgi:hypothetical protein